jgi:hypothetical protein
VISSYETTFIYKKSQPSQTESNPDLLANKIDYIIFHLGIMASWLKTSI